MANTDLVTEKQRSKQIDSYLKDEKKKYKNYVKNTMTLLLVGAGESGKSTIVKQMKILHQGGYQDTERLEFVPIIRGNLRDAILTITGNMQTIEPPIDLSDQSLKTCLDYMQDVASLPDFQYTEEFYDNAKMLWEDDGVVDCYGRANEYQLIDSAEYFLDQIDEIREEGYIPTDQDILRSRKITRGVLQTSFEVNKVHFHMLDVGGQRDERKKWIQCFPELTALIFVVACSSFDLVLREDQSQNRLQESLKLYERMWGNRFLKRTSVILFLNKQDILALKISKNPTILSRYFPDYTDFEPPETIEPPEGWCCFSTKKKRAKQRRRESMYPALSLSESREFFKAKSFIKAKFQNISIFINREQRFKKCCYPHYTCAVDQENVKRVFQDCEDMIQREHLKKYNLFGDVSECRGYYYLFHVKWSALARMFYGMCFIYVYGYQELSVCDSYEHRFVKRCYNHFTIAVNSENIRLVFDSCKDMIQRLHLENSGIIR